MEYPSEMTSYESMNSACFWTGFFMGHLKPYFPLLVDSRVLSLDFHFTTFSHKQEQKNTNLRNDALDFPASVNPVDAADDNEAIPKHR